QTYTETRQVVLPRGIDGRYYFHVVTDAAPYPVPVNGLVYEGANEQNNTGSTSIQVTYREPDLRVTDLIVPSTPPRSGETIPVTWTVTNIGSRDTRERGWTDTVYLSRDSSLDTQDVELGKFTRNGALAANAAYTATMPVTLPTGLAGAFYVLVFADAPTS